MDQVSSSSIDRQLKPPQQSVMNLRKDTIMVSFNPLHSIYVEYVKPNLKTDLDDIEGSFVNYALRAIGATCGNVMFSLPKELAQHGLCLVKLDAIMEKIDTCLNYIINCSVREGARYRIRASHTASWCILLDEIL